MKKDYLIIGCGLAGIAFCEQLKANKKTFVVYDDNSQQSSNVAGGLYNPVILKRFTPVWESKAQLEVALPLYSKIERALGVKLDYKIPVKRRFISVEEQNNWFIASDKEELSHYMSNSLTDNTNTALEAKFSLGEVLKTGRIDTKTLISTYKKDLKAKNKLFETVFNYDAIDFKPTAMIYEQFEVNQIIFAEGFGIKKNPFFKDLPLQGTKGELITIHAPNLKLDYVLKSSVFVIPLGNDLYRVGATYEWKDKTNTVTEAAKLELLTKLKTFLKCDFKVVNQVAGIRPTVSGRRPLVGRHQNYNNLYVLNGLGTRGVMIGPYVAKKLYDFIEHKIPLDIEIDCSRFFKKTT